MTLKTHLSRWIRQARSVRSRLRRRPKVFCIGRNKTGTTSLARALRQLGYHVAPQGPAELLLDDWAAGRFERLIEFCRWYDAFQDIPFSLDRTFEHLDRAFPGSKFILSIRDNAVQWYESMVRFQSQQFGRGGQLPSWDDLEAASYRAPGFMAKTHRLTYKIQSHELYDRRQYTAHYEHYNASVREYFAGRPHDLLELNLAQEGAYLEFCRFLKHTPRGTNFPWENASQNAGRSVARIHPANLP